jgi:hypothetical protein
MKKLGPAMFGVGCLGLLALQGCGSVCGDDGFAWQQKDNPACQIASQSASETETASASETETASAPTETTPTETNSNSDTETNSLSDSESNSNTLTETASDSETSGDGPFCADMDGDGFGDPTMCMPDEFPGSVPNDDDCDDTNPDTFPGSAENDSMTECMQDEDGDGFGDEMPDNPDVPPGTDCDDGSGFTFPGSAPLDDPDACMTDEDDDDYGDDNPGPGIDPGSDCADYDPVQHEECTGCEPNGAECVGDDLQECNADGTDFMVTPCAFGCDDAGEKCWDALTVEAGPSLCTDPNDPVQLDAMAMGGDGNYTWDWAPPMGLSDPTIPNPTAMPAGVTDYTVTVMDGEGNVAMDTVSVFLQDQSLPLDPVDCTIYDFPHDDVNMDPIADWGWDPNTSTLCQQVNAKASALFCGWQLDNATITGTFGVNQMQDDDWLGFMWGIQDTDHFYVFTWKQLDQAAYASCDGMPLDVPGGMQVKVINVLDPNTPLSCHDMHAPNDTANSTLLQSVAQFTTMGWEDNTNYIFELTHESDGDMTITVRRADNMMVVGMTSFNDTTYAKGTFGMYTKSQQNACFTDFTVSCL